MIEREQRSRDEQKDGVVYRMVIETPNDPMFSRLTAEIIDYGTDLSLPNKPKLQTDAKQFEVALAVEAGPAIAGASFPEIKAMEKSFDTQVEAEAYIEELRKGFA